MGVNLNQYKAKNTTLSKKVSKTTLSDLWTKDIQLFGASLSWQQKEFFYNELHTLLTAGIDMQRSLELLLKSQKKRIFQETFRHIQQSIIEGKAFSEALQASEQFSSYEIYSLQIGEESGQLPTVLKQLAVYYTKSITYRQLLIGALAYPVFVIGFAFLVIFFLLRYLVPLFSQIYERFGGELPWITSQIIALSNGLGTALPYLLLSTIGILFLFYWQRNAQWFKKGSAAVLLHLPIFGNIIKWIQLARLSQALFLLLSSGVPILRALQLVKKMLPFYPIETSIDQAEQGILEGQLLHENFQQHTFYPAPFVALVQIGEETSQLAPMFKKLADQYNQDVERRTAVIGSLIEPILIISLGILVGVILVAMYLPLFQMSVRVN